MPHCWHCASCLNKWGLLFSEFFACGDMETVSHFVSPVLSTSWILWQWHSPFSLGWWSCCSVAEHTSLSIQQQPQMLTSCRFCCCYFLQQEGHLVCKSGERERATSELELLYVDRLCQEAMIRLWWAPNMKAERIQVWCLTDSCLSLSWCDLHNKISPRLWWTDMPPTHFGHLRCRMGHYGHTYQLLPTWSFLLLFCSHHTHKMHCFWAWEAQWSGWVWVGECFFWYQPTRVVPD